ncbi:hypothetical protein CsSME_00049512 [Camellia sinensis var. sinensis]
MKEEIEKLWEEVRDLSLGTTTAGVERLHSPPTPLQFLRHFVSPNKPCLISNATLHWPATTLWSSSDAHLLPPTPSPPTPPFPPPSASPPLLSPPCPSLSLFNPSILPIWIRISSPMLSNRTIAFDPSTLLLPRIVNLTFLGLQKP